MAEPHEILRDALAWRPRVVEGLCHTLRMTGGCHEQSRMPRWPQYARTWSEKWPFGAGSRVEKVIVQIVTGAEIGGGRARSRDRARGGPHVRIFKGASDGHLREPSVSYAYGAAFDGGLFVASGGGGR